MFSFNSYARTEPDHSDSLLRDRIFSFPLSQLLDVIRLVADHLPRCRFVSYNRDKGEVHIERHTPLIPFTDDIYLYLRDVEKGVLLWGHSASRIGSWDLGVNGRNLRIILGELDRQADNAILSKALVD